MQTLAFEDWYENHQERVLSDFFTFLRFPSISTNRKYEQDIRKTASWLSEYMKKMGLEVDIWETSNFPVVFGSYKAGSSRPTLLIYHHYDVQPTDPLDLWDSDPFEPIIKENCVYARGSSDNKGQCFYSLTALKAYLELSAQIDINIKIVIEGEEESGSKGIKGILETKKEELRADYLIIGDAGVSNIESPAVTLGMRGIAFLEIECKNSFIDLHSGIHGGIALNPNRALATLLANIWKPSGKVAIPHFYDDVQLPVKKWVNSLDMTFDQDLYTKEFGVHAFSNEKGYSLQESNWLRPSLEVNGMWGGYIESGFKTVIPSKAHAKISCRLVPNQDPQKIAQNILKYFKKNAPPGIEISVKIKEGCKAFRCLPDSVIAKTAAIAYEEVFKKPCKYISFGATIPIIPELVIASSAEAILMGVALGTDNVHAPNEHFRMDCFKLGFLVMTSILTRLSQRKE